MRFGRSALHARVPTHDLRRAVLDAADGIRRARNAPDLSRSHDDAARCHGCGYLHGCGVHSLVAFSVEPQAKDP